MSSLDLDKKFIEIIERKHNELNLGKDYSKKFSKIKDFEANAIGQIGEVFVKEIIASITEIIDDGVIHDEYDIKTESGILFEVKTARKGRKNNTFQFNGIDPKYNYDYLVCIGVCEDKILYRMFSKSTITYIHGDQKYYVTQGDYKRQLVKMNPNNLVNLKLTINEKDLYEIPKILDELTAILT